MITQNELAEIALLTKRVEELTAVKKLLEAKEQEILSKLRGHAHIESGALTCRNAPWQRVNVRWKELFIEHVSQKKADAIVASAFPDTYDKLVVEAAPSVDVATIKGTVSFGGVF